MQKEVIKVSIPKAGEQEDSFITAHLTFVYDPPERIDGYGLKPGEWQYTGIESSEPVECDLLEDAIESAREQLRA